MGTTVLPRIAVQILQLRIEPSNMLQRNPQGVLLIISRGKEQNMRAFIS